MMIYNDKVYGKQEIKDRLVLDIIRTKEMQRLRGVNQYGVWKYITPWMTTTRFEHCLGVYFLLRKMGAGREEQIAGLVHDIGHTAFSHAFDYVVGRIEEQDFNDQAQAGILMNSDIKKLLAEEGVSINFILDHKNFPLLEKKLPDLCADRIDYILRDSLNYGITKKEEIMVFMKSLKTEKNRIFFDGVETAKKLAFRFMRMDNEYWRSPKQGAIYCLIGQALKIAVKNDIITQNDFFETDEFVMEKLRRSGKQDIINKINLINPNLKVKDDRNDYDFFVRGKLRYIDPLVLIDGRMRKLSDIDDKIKKRIDYFKKEYAKGHYIKIIES